jgi:hypothetical protein
MSKVKTSRFPLSPSKVKSAFSDAYHDPIIKRSLKNMRGVITGNFYLTIRDSNHVTWLLETFNRLEKAAEYEGNNWELPGMLYGMIYTAFDKALEVYSKWIVVNYPELLSQIDTEEDAVMYLQAEAESQFLHMEDPVPFISVRTLINLFGKVLYEKNMLHLVHVITPELMARVYNLALGAKGKGLEALKKDIKTAMSNFLEEYVKTV